MIKIHIRLYYLLLNQAPLSVTPGLALALELTRHLV
jgi:hypothetical protein